MGDVFRIAPLLLGLTLAGQPRNADWAYYLGDKATAHYSPLDQINTVNAGKLALKWSFETAKSESVGSVTPIVVDGVMYAPTPGRAIVAVDAATGKEIWRRKLPTAARPRMQDAPARRGLVYWPGDGTAPARVLFGFGEWIYSVDPRTGEPTPGFGTDGRTEIPTSATASGAIFKNIYVICGLFGDAYGYDVRDGRMLWRFRSVPRDGEFGAETWDKPQLGANGWGGLSIDDARGIAFVAFGAPRPDMTGTLESFHVPDAMGWDLQIGNKIAPGR